MSRFGVSPEKEAALARRMLALGIREADLDESFVRSSGPGGQNVNKVATCVVLRHRPTVIEVKCSRERTQALNRFFARRLLADRVEERLTGRVPAEEARREKIRKQKARRRRRGAAPPADRPAREA
ncbi:MAG: peptide chain release factor-like protein [Planctomycetes bacterium]|nr:peptide chain release factor-like protein [Planctomycetota bacterium]